MSSLHPQIGIDESFDLKLGPRKSASSSRCRQTWGERVHAGDGIPPRCAGVVAQCLLHAPAMKRCDARAHVGFGSDPVKRL